MSGKCLGCLTELATMEFGCGHNCYCKECLDKHLKYSDMCPICKSKIVKFSKNSHEIIESYKEELSPRSIENLQQRYIDQINEFNNFIKTLDFKNYTSIAVIEMDDGCSLQFRSHTGKPNLYLFFKGDEQLSKSYVEYCRGNFNRLAIESVKKQLDNFEAKYVIPKGK